MEKEDLVEASLRYLDMCIAIDSVVSLHRVASTVPEASPSAEMLTLWLICLHVIYADNLLMRNCISVPLRGAQLF
ncbi:hypothetical protein V6N13_012841 [Hibiscus sabdariffa]